MSRRISRVRIQNWMAYRGTFNLELPGGPIGVLARYEGNPRRSNWAGKTAFLEVFKFALTGVHRKRTLDALITRGETKATVAIELSDRTVVKRTLERGRAQVIEVITPSGQIFTGDAAVETLSDIVPDVKDAEATYWFAQGDTEALVGQRSGERRALIWRWLELDVWDRALAKARERGRANEIELEAIRRAEVPAEVNVTLTEGLAGMHRAKIAELEARLEEIDAELDEVKAARAGEWQIAELEKLRTDAKSLRSQISGLTIHPDADLEALKRTVAEADRALGVALAEARAAETARSPGSWSGTCPVTRKACGIADEVRSDVDALEKRSREARAALEKAERERALQSAGLDSMVQARARRAGLVERFNATTEKIRALVPEVEKVKAELAAIDVDVPALEADRARTRAAIAEARTMLGRCEADIDRAARDAERARAREAAREAAERKARIASLVARALGPNGIPSKIASVAIADLESRANALLEGTGLSFEFGWGRDTKELASICYTCGRAFPKTAKAKVCEGCGAQRGQKRSDDLEILVDDGSGEIEDATMKSGGARVLVATAIRLASGAMLREQMIARGWGDPVTFALVDEPFGALDTENREELARKFSAMLGAVGLEQALIVSHDAPLLDALPAKVVVTRRGDASTLHLEA